MGGRLDYAIQPLKSWFYLALISVFLLNQFAEKVDLSFAYQRAYLDDVLVVPVVLPFVLFLLRTIFYKQIRFINLVMLISFIVSLSFIFEFVLPGYSSKYTADSWDVLCYLIGGGIYWGYQHYLYRKQIA
jgi:hypothetical protein